MKRISHQPVIKRYWGELTCWKLILSPAQKKKEYSQAGSREQTWFRPGESQQAIFHGVPIFICCSLGSEFYWVRNGTLCPSNTWAERIRRSGYSRDNVEGIVSILLKKGLPLQKQPEDYQGPYKMSYYYSEGPAMARDFACIQALADERRVRVVFTRCNPAAGDPADCYDVEFIPLCCGKDQAVSFLMAETTLPKEAVIAFGDSANDFAMFAQAGKGYLVGNADPFAIKQYGNSLEGAYCHGILKVLKELQG
ncbi:Predicted hydrolases of the HAD superfamily [Erwinia amylovora CFBP 2585]|nr:Predicted hydrolases of the HAD superfamily [Erwinia amylovora CFBP 2585]